MRHAVCKILNDIVQAKYPAKQLREDIRVIDKDFSCQNIDGLKIKIMDEKRLSDEKIKKLKSSLFVIQNNINNDIDKQIVCIKYINELIKRDYSLQTFKKILDEEKYDTPFTGYSGLKLKIPNLFGSELDQLLKVIKSSYQRLIAYNKKMMFFYQIDKKEIKNFKIFLSTLADKNSNAYQLYSTNYPYPIDDKSLELLNVKDSLAFLAVEDSKIINTLSVKFCIKKYYRSSEEIPLDALSDKYKDQYHKLKGFKDGVIQSFEFIKFDYKTGILQIYVDMAPKIITSDGIDYMQNILMPFLEKNYLQATSQTLCIEKIDLFNKMADLYDEQDGLVYSLSHITPSGSPKQEKMAKKTEDLRTEDFHKGGLKAVNQQTNIYRLYKIYEFDSKNFIALDIPGETKFIHNNQIKINYAIFYECTKLDHIHFLTSKLLS